MNYLDTYFLICFKHPKADLTTDKCPLCPKILCRDKRFGFQHHLVEHNENTTPDYLKYLKERYDIIKSSEETPAEDGLGTSKVVYKRKERVQRPTYSLDVKRKFQQYKKCIFCPDKKTFLTYTDLHRHCDKMV